eukprot:scaffold84977_cov48-Phaeocystis_antarctica.AAC.1
MVEARAAEARAAAGTAVMPSTTSLQHRRKSTRTCQRDEVKHWPILLQVELLRSGNLRNGFYWPIWGLGRYR